MLENQTSPRARVSQTFRTKRFLLFFFLFLFSLFGILFFNSCSHKNDATSQASANGFLYRMFHSFDPRNFLENLGRNVIPPLYQDLSIQADALKSDSDNLCGSVSISQFQATWRLNISALKKVEMFPFGPAVSNYPRVDSFSYSYLTETPPVDEDLDLIDQFSGTLPAASIYLGTIPKDAKGIVGIEYLAFSQASPSRGTDPDCTSLSGSRLFLLQAMVNQYRANVHAMTDLWDTASTSPYGEELAKSGVGGSAFSSSGAALDAIFAGAIQILTTMKDGRLEIPAGISGGRDGSSPEPNRAESRFSGRSFLNLQDNLSSFKAVYTGNGTGAGLSDYVKFYSPTLDDEVQGRVAQLETQLSLIVSQGDWSQTNIQNIKLAVSELGDIVTILNTELAALVGASPVSGGPGGDGD